MQSRALVFLLAFLVGWIATGQAAETHQGKVVSTSASTLTMADLEGKQPHTMDIPRTATIARDGNLIALAELQPGETITVTTDKLGSDPDAVTKVEATPSGR